MKLFRAFGWVLLAFIFMDALAWSSSISTVSTVGEATVTIKGNDRAAAFKRAVREALKDAVLREASLLVDNPEDLTLVEEEVNSRLKDFVVKYRVLEARFIQSQDATPGDWKDQGAGSGSWYVKVEAFIDSDLLQRTVVGREPIEGG